MSSPGKGWQAVSHELQQGLLCPLLPVWGARLPLFPTYFFCLVRPTEFSCFPEFLVKTQCILHGQEEAPLGGSIPEAAQAGLQKELPGPLWTSLGLPHFRSHPTTSSPQNWKFHQENKKEGHDGCSF